MKHASQDDIKKLGELISDIKVAMLTTAMPDGTLRSRPMMTQTTEFDGVLWFFTHADAAKTDEIRNDQHVNLAYAHPSKEHYVSVSGIGMVVRDRKKAEELWNPIYRAWFPDGLDDPNLALLRVQVTAAEYWDTPSSKVVQLAGFVKAMVTGKEYHPGHNEKLSLGQGQPGDAGRATPEAESSKKHGDPLGAAADLEHKTRQ